MRNNTKNTFFNEFCFFNATKKFLISPKLKNYLHFLSLDFLFQGKNVDILGKIMKFSI